MKTVLLGWELGGGLGHAARLREVGEALAGRGHRVVYALRDVVVSRALFPDHSAPILPAPLARTDARGHAPLCGYADLLAVHGYASASRLGALVGAWQRLIDLVRPDLIVAEHAPTLCVAAAGEVPVAVVGTGFGVPPAGGREFPALRPELPPVVDQARMLDAVREVQRARGRPIPERLPGVLDAALRAVCVWSELDPYAGIRESPAGGPLHAPPAPSPRGAGIFAYLNPGHPAIETLGLWLGDAARHGPMRPVGAWLPYRDEALGGFLSARGVAVQRGAPDLDLALRDAALVIHHAGAVVAQAALAAGRVQLLLPLDEEARLNARVLERLGVGICLEGVPDRQRLDDVLQALGGDPGFAERAAALAGSLAARGAGSAGSRSVIDCCAALLG